MMGPSNPDTQVPTVTIITNRQTVIPAGQTHWIVRSPQFAQPGANQRPNVTKASGRSAANDPAAAAEDASTGTGFGVDEARSPLLTEKGVSGAGQGVRSSDMWRPFILDLGVS
jgi:hypothetical protein